jgi:CBS domain-containing protein
MICPSCDWRNLPGADWCAWCQLDLSEFDRPVPGDRVERSLMWEPVECLGPRPPVCLSAQASAAEAVQAMARQDVGAVLLLDAAGALAGIFTERDLLLKVDLESPSEMARPVSDFMTRGPESVRSSDPLAFALHLMDCGGFRHLPVLTEGKLSGIISVRDMLRHITGICASLPRT